MGLVLSKLWYRRRTGRGSQRWKRYLRERLRTVQSIGYLLSTGSQVGSFYCAQCRRRPDRRRAHGLMVWAPHVRKGSLVWFRGGLNRYPSCPVCNPYELR